MSMSTSIQDFLITFYFTFDADVDVDVDALQGLLQYFEPTTNADVDVDLRWVDLNWLKFA